MALQAMRNKLRFISRRLRWGILISRRRLSMSWYCPSEPNEVRIGLLTAASGAWFHLFHPLIKHGVTQNYIFDSVTTLMPEPMWSAGFSILGIAVLLGMISQICIARVIFNTMGTLLYIAMALLVKYSPGVGGVPWLNLLLIGLAFMSADTTLHVVYRTRLTERTPLESLRALTR